MNSYSIGNIKPLEGILSKRENMMSVNIAAAPFTNLAGIIVAPKYFLAPLLIIHRMPYLFI